MSAQIDTALRLSRAAGGRTWTATDPRWAALTPYQRAAAMALLEADGANPADARNALGAMINRAQREGQDLGVHVGRPIYQPAIEPAQQARLDRVLRHPEFGNLSTWAERRAQGHEDDPVQGATHFLAPEKTMLALEAREPQKYKSWRTWTNFDPESSSYRGVIMRDGSHAFLSPDGTAVQPTRAAPAATGDPSAVVTTVPASAAPSATFVPARATESPDGVRALMPASSDLEAASRLASLVAPQQPKFYDVPQLQPVSLGGGNMQAGLAMADAAGLARGYPGAPSSAERAVRLARADGGGVPAADDTGANLPESDATLVAQQQQLLEGRRPAQMFPVGTKELPVPPGIGRVVTSRGVFHYNPDKITAAEIVAASAAGRENEVLGLGPMSKADVMDASAASGQRPVAITERDPFGVEVKAALAAPATVGLQSRDILADKAPENSVGVEPVESMLQDRIMQRTGEADLNRDRTIETALRVGAPQRADGGSVSGLLDSGALGLGGQGGGLGLITMLPQLAGGEMSGIGLLSKLMGKNGDKPDSKTDGDDEATKQSTSNAISLLSGLSGSGFAGYARGGSPKGFDVPYANPIPYASGPVMGSTAGRADKVPTTVRGGSHVIPADVVSSLGQGNTTAGMGILSKMFKAGPYGMPARPMRRADGGSVPVMVSDGEFVVPPEAVAALGGGDQDAGHEVLDAFILNARQTAIETMKRLPPPAKD